MTERNTENIISGKAGGQAAGSRSHGGDWRSYEEKFGREPLDFSANVSPLGVPESVRDAVIRSLSLQDRYPDPSCRRLTRALAEKNSVPENWILCGNGAADLIWRISLTCRRGLPALLTAPAFAEYEAALHMADADIRFLPLDEKDGFRLPHDLPERIPARGILFLGNPDNPAGRTISRKLLERVLFTAREKQTIVVLDESFLGFLQIPEEQTALRFVRSFPNLILLRAFTKIFGMAGFRLGYCITSDTDQIRRMKEAGQPWAVSGLAEEAGLAALSDKDYLRMVRRLIQEERPFLQQGLEDAGLRVIPGEANYLLFRGPEDLSDALRRRGILIRDCRNYRGLTPGWVRTAVRTHDENIQLLHQIREVMHGTF